MPKIAKDTWLLILSITQSAIEAARVALGTKGRRKGSMMEEQRLDFIEELLQESNARREQETVEMNKLMADRMLAAIAVLEGQMEEVNQLVETEIKLLEEYRSSQLTRLDKKRSWLAFNLEGFMRSSGEKTVRLPHGSMKLRKGRDKAIVVALEEFLTVGPKLGLVRTIPEQATPDIQAIVNHIKTIGEIPAGVTFIPADIRFSYSTNGGKDESE
jgi:hypothetical protein